MPKPKQVSNHSYLVGDSSLSGPGDCCIYIVDVGDGKTVLIDTGVGRGHQRLVKNIETLGFEPSDIIAVVLTHGHIDHIGGAVRIKELYGSEVIAHVGDQAAIEGRAPERTAADWYGVAYSPVAIDTVLTGPVMSRRIGALEFHFVHTPGHTPGSIAVYIDDDGTRVLFAQDVHGPFDPSFGSNIEQWHTSMQQLIALDADVLCEGHFGIYRPADRARKYIEGYIARFNK